MSKEIQAKSITDAQIIAAVVAAREQQGTRRLPATLWGVQEYLAQFPPKVVQAKLRVAIKKKLITGCTCGCRGDFEVVEPGVATAMKGATL